MIVGANRATRDVPAIRRLRTRRARRHLRGHGKRRIEGCKAIVMLSMMMPLRMRRVYLRHSGLGDVLQAQFMHLLALRMANQCFSAKSWDSVLRHEAIEGVQHPPLLFSQQVVRGCDMVMLVHLQTLHRIVPREAEGIELPQHILLKAHLPRRQISWRCRGLRDLAVPWVRTNDRYGEAARWIRREKPRDEILDGLADEFRRAVACGKDLLVKLCRLLILEGEVAADKGEENDPTAPEVAKGGHVAVAGNHLRCSVARRATGRLQELLIPEDVAQAEIYDFDTPVLIEQEILWLQVTVDYVHGMDLLNTCNYLVEEAGCLGFLDTAVGDDVIEQFATASVLHNEIQLPACLYDFIELDDVRVSDQLEDVHLSSNPLHICHLDNALLLQHLDRHSFAGQDVGAELHLAKGALANGFAQNVVADRLRSCPPLAGLRRHGLGQGLEARRRLPAV
mmetsp:Transcript_73652/g.159358  ORF Transcript_73652/g.159358 Transcript_73652/m.159358 type:complete len:451 (+) Transcript_73652:1224-2576(+)